MRALGMSFAIALAAAGCADPLTPADVTVRANGVPRVTSVSLPTRAFDRDTIPLVATGIDTESDVWITVVDGNAERGRVPNGDTLWWVPAGPTGDRTVVVRAVDAQGFSHDSAIAIRVTDGSRVRWTAMGARRGYGTGVITDWGAITAVGPSGDIAVAFYHGSPCYGCLWVFSSGGALRWKVELDNALGDHSAGLTIAPDGSLYAMAFGGWLYRYASDGTLRWSRQGVGGDPHGRFALDPIGRLYVGANGTNDPVLARLDPATGNDVWRISEVGSAGYSAGPTVLGDLSVTAQLGFAFHHVNADSLALTPAVDLLPIASHYMGAADARGFTYLVNRSGGTDALVAVGPDNTVRWRTASPTGASVAEPVIDADTTLYTATRNVRNTDVMAVRHDGSVLWTRNVPNSSYIPRLAVLSDGTVLVTVAYCLYRFAAATGDILDTIEFPTGVESALAVTGDGTIYVVIADGRLLALQGWAPLDPDAPWPIWRRDNARTASVPRP